MKLVSLAIAKRLLEIRSDSSLQNFLKKSSYHTGFFIKKELELIPLET